MATTASLSSSNAPDHVKRHVRLINASVSGNETEIRQILAEEDWPSLTDFDTLRQALVKVATKGNLKVLRLLLDSGADVHPKKDNELSPLFKAAEAGHLAIVLELLDHHADPNWQVAKTAVAGQSALFKAAEAGHLAVVTTLLARGANPNLRTKSGQTALHLACLRGRNTVVKALLDGGAHPDGGRGQDGKAGDRDGRTPLLLISAEKLPEDKGSEEKTNSVQDFHEEISPRKKKNVPNKNPAEKISKWNTDTVKLLLTKGANPNAKDSTKRSPLHWAATNGYAELARCLLGEEFRKTTDIDATQNRGKTALHLASEHDRVEILDILLSHGASLDPRSDGRWTPLINAAEKGHATVVAKLLDAGADVNADLSNHMTALHWAAFNGNEEVVRLLLERSDINLSSKDQFERTPMLCAAERRHSGIVRLLSPTRHAHRLSETAREATKKFEATIVDFGEFQFEKYQKNEVKEKKPQLVFKHTVYDLLYGLDDKTGQATVPVLTKNIKWQPQFRWIHLPSNNIAWIEALLAKSFIEGGHRDVEGFKALGKCFDQEHRGPLSHANFMRPYCHHVPSRRAEKEDSSLGSVAEHGGEQDKFTGQTTLAGTESIATEYSETSTGKSADGRKKGKSEQIAERHPQRPKRNKGPPGNPPGTKEARLSSRQSSIAPSLASTEAFRQLVDNGKMVLFVSFCLLLSALGRLASDVTLLDALSPLRDS